MNKKFVIINTFLIFFMGFLVHGLYKWYPSVITSFFPVNESLYEHVKLIFMSPIIASTILYFVFKSKKINIHNFVWGLFVSTIFNILLYYIVYIPFYYQFGANMFFTLGWYFLSIVISQCVNFRIINKDNHRKYNFLGTFLILSSIGLLTYLTYFPLHSEFFRDPETNSYGINK